VFELSELAADRWVARNGENSRALLGFPESPHRVSFVVEHDGVTRTNTVEFGGLRNGTHPFAAVVLDGGDTWYFDFPPVPYYEHVKVDLTLPEGD